MLRKLTPFIAVALFLAIAPGSASAQSQVFRSSDPVNIPSNGNPTPASTSVVVSGMQGPVTDIEVSLEGLSHLHPDDLDVVLMTPDGFRIVLMSDVCGGADVANHTWTFKGRGPLIPAMPDELSCPGTFYLDTNRAGGDVESFPGTGGGPFVALGQLFRQVMNGEWRLAVFDDQLGNSGALMGWSISLTTGDTHVRIPHQGTSGLANPYPQRATMVANDRIITDLDAGVPRLSHSRPDDLELLLVGPRDQQVLLMSDACGERALNDVNLYFDDEAPAQRPDGSTGICPAAGKPTDHEPGDRLPTPAPQGPYSNTLDVFDGAEVGGEWSLYAFDDAAGADGYTLAPFALDVESRPKAALTFAEGTVEVAEGGRRSLVIRRAPETALGPGAITLTTTPGTAAAGTDYTPVTTTLPFASGERDKAIELDALADAVKEAPETFTVTLSQPSGDARLGAAATATVSIRDVSAGAEPDPVTETCGGRTATITGTAKRDVLRGTPGADVIAALSGKDTVKAGAGKDVVCGGPGKDRLKGGAGRDACSGGPGRDRVRCERKRAR